jgi:hypothetical protein
MCSIVPLKLFIRMMSSGVVSGFLAILPGRIRIYIISFPAKDNARKMSMFTCRASLWLFQMQAGGIFLIKAVSVSSFVSFPSCRSLPPPQIREG